VVSYTGGVGGRRGLSQKPVHNIFLAQTINVDELILGGMNFYSD